MEHNNDKEDLLVKYNKGLCTEEEKALVETWFKDRKEEGYTPSKEQIGRVAQEVWINMHEEETLAQTKIISWPYRIVSVAAILVSILGIATYIFVQTSVPVVIKNDVEPGKNEAVLTLADGSKISLNTVSTGTIGNQKGIKITKTADGKVVYESTASHPDSGQNTITTPRGGQYQVILPDGSHVWLNAASKLIYPVSFNGREDRRVDLSGEAYFEVTKNKAQPFIVISQKQEVLVVGTHFNISSYPDEPNTKTTLLEGSVKILTTPVNPAGSMHLATSPPYLKEGWSKTGVVLKPGQQSINSGTAIKIKTEGIEDAIAWKDGEFSFREEPLESIMLKISRWYNVEVIYKNQQARKKVFGGTISRFEKVSEVLKMLELAGNVKFTIEERRITVE